MKDYKRLTFKIQVDPYDDDCEETEPAAAASYDELLNRLAKLEDKIENGTLVELPCKEGDILYGYTERHPTCAECEHCPERQSWGKMPSGWLSMAAAINVCKYKCPPKYETIPFKVEDLGEVCKFTKNGKIRLKDEIFKTEEELKEYLRKGVKKTKWNRSL